MMGVALNLLDYERRVSPEEFAQRMNICVQELYKRIKAGLILPPKKDGRKSYWLNSYVFEQIIADGDLEKY